MRITKGLTIGLFTCLLVGTVLAFVPITRNEVADAPAFTVPAGRIGDQVAYDRFERSDGAAWVPAGAQAFTLTGLSATVDDEGVAHATLTLEWVPQWGDPRCPEAPETLVPIVHHLALDSGSPVRRDVAFRPDPCTVVVASDFGPHFVAAEPSVVGPEWWAQADPTLVGGHGLRFGDGERIAAWHLEAAFAHAWALDRPGSGLTSFATRAGAADLDGQVTATWTVAGRAMLTRAQESTVPFLSFAVPAGTEIGFSRTQWFAPGDPYPLRIEDTLDAPTGRLEVLLHRVGFVRTDWDGVEIPWTHSSPAPLAVDVRAGPHPVDGVARSPWSLAAALARLRDAPEYAAFQRWSDLHPDARLVTASNGSRELRTEVGGMPRLSGDGGPHWVLEFATPDGDAMRAVVYKDMGADSTRDGLWELSTSSSTVQSFAPTDWPERFVTFASAAEVAQQALVGHRVSYVEWGGITPARNAATPGAVSGQDTLRVHMDDAFRIDVGPLSGGVAYYGTDTDRVVTIDAATGRPLALRQVARWIRDAQGVENQIDSTVDALEPGPPPAEPAATAAPETPASVVAVTTTLLALFLTAYFLPALRFAATRVFILAFTRIHPGALEVHATRARITKMIREDPGVSPPEIHKAIGGGWTTVVYHLRVLEKGGVVRSFLDGRHRRYFPKEAMTGHSARSALRNRKTREVWGLLRTQPGLRRVEIARRMGFSPPAAAWHLKRLEAAGLAGADRLGRRVAYYALSDEVASRERPDPSFG
jgi:predicted transcriptional regulator